jgi:putative sigma-54 modulation protein
MSIIRNILRADPECSSKKGVNTMELELRQKDIVIGQSLQEHIAGYIDAALRRFAGRIYRVTIWLADINGSRGGIDKQCRIAVQLSKGKTIRTENTNTNVAAATYYAVDRAAYAICREIKRRRRISRKTRSHDSDDE